MILKKILILIVLLNYSTLSYSRNDESYNLDLTPKFGMMFGTTKSGTNKRLGSQIIGGLMLGASFNFDFSKYFTNYVEPQIIIELGGFTIVRTGATVGLAYHFIGGPFMIEENISNLGVITYSSSHNVSFVIRAGIFSYTATDPKNIAEPVKGSLVEIGFGFEYRMSLSDLSAISVQVLISPISFPSSVERLSVYATEASLGWRIII